PRVIARDLLTHARRVADQEAVARERLEVVREALPRRERLVLLPRAIREVLALEERPRLGERGGGVGSDVALTDQRDRARRRPAERRAHPVEERQPTRARGSTPIAAFSTSR